MKIKNILAVCLLVGILAVPASAQDLLPASFGNWTAAGPATHVAAGQIEQFSAEQAAILREYGIGSAERRDFAQGPKTATVTVYNMVDPSAAFGSFTFLRVPQMTALDLSDAAPYTAGARDRALLVVGNFLLEVSSPQARPVDADLKQLATALARRADTRPYPRIGDFLPQQGLVHGSEQYVLGPKAMASVFPKGTTGQTDWIGFGKSAEAIVAHYRFKDGGPDSLLLIATYPTQQIAAEQFAALPQWFALNSDASRTASRPLVFGTRSSSLVALLTGTDSRESAEQILSQIHYGTDVTWNEATHELTDPSISAIVVGGILDTGSIMLLAVAAGLGFGGFRLFMKHLLPGKVFDRNDSVEILQLGLGSKPIQAKDFYQ